MITELNEQLKTWGACEDGFRWATTSCATLAEVWDKCERGDWLIWLLQKHGRDSRKEKIQVAVACAEHVIGIYESQYPNDDRPRKAIEAAKACIENDTPENRATYVAAYTSAYAAADAADAACAADVAGAACAADAADAACAADVADAARAADTACAARAAAYAMTDVADAAAYTAAYTAERKWQAYAIRKIVANPFVEESK